jgi:RsiW-degrading membrane proteinase PrsW (M82 family)
VAKDTEKPMGPYARAAGLTAMAFVLLVIELVAFSWVAYLFKVKMDPNTMPLNWQVGFWSLFLIPGLFCFLALMNLVSTMSD